MAVTRVEFNALKARVTALEGDPPAVEPVTPVPPVTRSITLSAPAVVVKGATYTATAVVTANTAAKFTYLQLAVRGAGAKDLALTPNASMAAGDTKTLSGSGRGSGAHTAYLAYSPDGTTWVDGPKTTFTLAGDPTTDPVETDPPSTDPPVDGHYKIDLVGKSGLGFNSLVFRQLPAQAGEFGRRRGVPMDGLLTFSGRQNWNDFRWVPDGTPEYVQSGHIVVNSMPHAPESEGDAMNSKGANDAYRDEQRALGKHLKDAGLNVANYVVRVDWECNGNWYRWSANRPGGWQALRESIKNYVTNLRAGGATKVTFDLCYNKGPNQSGAAFEIFPGPEYIDVIGIDQYDMWSPSFSQGDWDREMAKGPSARIVAEFARKHGIQWAWDEGGNTHGDRNQGGDNPLYWQYRRAEIERNIENLAWDNTYDHEGAPASLAHDFNQNPKSWPVYKQLWTPR